MVDEKSKTPPSPTAVEVPPDHEAGNGPPQRDKPEPITTTATTQIQSPSPSPVAVQDSQQDAQGPLAPSTAWTGHQLFYIFGLDGVGAMGLSGGVNFAIAYGTTPPRTSSPISPALLLASRAVSSR